MNDWELTTPEQRLTAKPPFGYVAAWLTLALQDGDVAVVLTRPQLERLIQMVEPMWTSGEDFEILKNLKRLRGTTP